MAIADVSGRSIAGRSIAELMSLRGRTAVVTGGARGLGKAIAARLAEAGASVLIGDVRQDEASATAEDLSRRFGTRVIAAALDVRQADAVAAAADLAVEQLGGLDVWVNNAGVFPSTPLTEMTDEAWDQVKGYEPPPSLVQ